MESNTLFSTHGLIIGRGQFHKSIPDFSLSIGEMLHLKGDNGSGKTTFVKTLMGEIPLISGSIEFGFSKRNATYLKQEFAQEMLLPISVREWLEAFHAVEMGQKILHPNLLNKRFNNLSGGEKQKVSIISKLQHNSSLLILDEPFNHVDINSRNELMVFFRNLIEHEHIKALLLIGHHDFLDMKVVTL